MSVFEVVVLGVGDAFSEHHHPSALLLVCEGFHLLVDCPDMIRGVLREASQRSQRTLALSAIDHVVITHLHGDHVNGLEGMAFFKHFVENKRVSLLITPEVENEIWDHRLRASMARLWTGQELRAMTFQDYFDVIPLCESEETRVGPFRIRIHPTRHHVPTSALQVEAQGRVLGYSSDTAFDRTLIEFLEPSHLIIHETNLGPAHTDYAELALLPEALRGKMRLIHYPDGWESPKGGIARLSEGEVVVV